MSQHRVDVISVRLEKHHNADSLSVVRIGEFTVVARTQDWADGQLAAYIEPDMVVPASRSEFAFLSTSHKEIQNSGVTGYRIRVKKLRGVMSMGMLVPAPMGSLLGDNVIEHLGIVRYEPPMPVSTGGERVSAPRFRAQAGDGPCILDHKYDVESGYRYAGLFEPGETVVATEKIHGANGRFVFVDGEMFAGSRTEWKKNDPGILWWKALANTPKIRDFCVAHPGITIYGEVYGQVQDLKYGAGQGYVAIACFDLMLNGKWINHDEARAMGDELPWVPELYRGPFDKEKLFAMADGKSEVAKMLGADQIREGIVIKPLVERANDQIGRTQIKIVSNAYLERA